MLLLPDLIFPHYSWLSCIFISIVKKTGLLRLRDCLFLYGDGDGQNGYLLAPRNLVSQLNIKVDRRSPFIKILGSRGLLLIALSLKNFVFSIGSKSTFIDGIIVRVVNVMLLRSILYLFLHQKWSVLGHQMPSATKGFNLFANIDDYAL